MLRSNLGRILRTSAGTLLLGGLLGLAAPPAGADSMYLKIEGVPAVEGEATAKGYEKHIEVLSWSWGLTNATGNVPRTGGLGAGRVAMSELTIMKTADASTPRLISLASQGKRSPKAILTVVRSSDGFPYLKITLEDVLVSSLQLSAGGERPTESVAFSFAKVGIEYWPGPGQTRVFSGWDVAKNVAFTPAP